MAIRKKAAHCRLFFRALGVAASLVVAVPALAAAPADDPAAVRAMLAAGAPELSLAEIEALQPRDRTASGWAQWEGLRCETLAQLARRGTLLARAGSLPEGPLPPPLNVCLLEAARAAIAQNEPQTARSFAARLLWQSTPPTAEHTRAARLAVIESYVLERRGEDAFHSMLRFRQDYQPLDRAVSDGFAEALLDLGRDADALDWLTGSEVTPARLRLQLRSGVLAPDAVISEARAALERSSDPAYWRAIHEAAVRAKNGPLQVDALERLLQTTPRGDAAAQAEAAQRLWVAYRATAGEIGNREQLLIGDDGAWADYAARSLGSNPLLSRSVFAYLARAAQNAEIRRSAQLQLVHSLASSGLDLAAVRAMERIGTEIDALDAQTRYLLGTLAAKRNDAAVALRFWNGLTPPANVNAIEWQLTLARTALAAGDASASARTLERLLVGRDSVSRELAQLVLEIGQEMLDMRTMDAAQAVYALLASRAPTVEARAALFGLGRAHELSGEPVDAASAYLRSALLVQAAAPDTLAYQARLLAGLNLMRAGMKRDARAQFEWLLKNSKEPALSEAAKRALERL